MVSGQKRAQLATPGDAQFLVCARELVGDGPLRAAPLRGDHRIGEAARSQLADPSAESGRCPCRPGARPRDEPSKRRASAWRAGVGPAESSSTGDLERVVGE